MGYHRVIDCFIMCSLRCQQRAAVNDVAVTWKDRMGKHAHEISRESAASILASSKVLLLAGSIIRALPAVVIQVKYHLLLVVILCSIIIK